MKNLVVLSGAGMSQESGIPTFRDLGGIWENYDVTELACSQAWAKNMDLVLRFYNIRREKVIEAFPNKAHELVSQLESYYNVCVVTQNVDDLHERAGSSNVLHLHGEIRKSRSTKNPELIFDIEGSHLNRGDLCPLGSQLRPHVVWFGEDVPAFDDAISLVESADVLVVIGTSLNVYPAAGLIDYASRDCVKYLVDPGVVGKRKYSGIQVIKEKASVGMEILFEKLILK